MAEASSDTKARIRAEARAIGFDAVGFASAAREPRHARNLAAYLAAGHHGDMNWMAETAQRRAAPQSIWPEARSVVVLAVNYAPPEDPLAVLGQRERASISVYARNRDYHDLVKKRLKRLARWMAKELGCAVKVFVDTAPVMEKPLAERAGLGWQGKHTNLVSRHHGSWLFLGEVFCDLDLEPDASESDHCGSCRLCQDICPTKAFPAPYRLDARRCISYLTIEHKGHIDREFREAIGNRIFGCDDCLAICPWNKFARAHEEPAFVAREGLNAPLLASLAELDDAAFRQLFSGSPIKRIGRDRFLRNVLIGIGNSGAPDLAETVRRRLDDPSALVRAMAVWAYSRLVQRDILQREGKQRMAVETDPAVRQEWSDALG